MISPNRTETVSPTKLLTSLRFHKFFPSDLHSCCGIQFKVLSTQTCICSPFYNKANLVKEHAMIIAGAKQGGKADSAQNIQNFLKTFRERFSKTGGGRRGCAVFDQLVDILLIGWW